MGPAILKKHKGFVTGGMMYHPSFFRRTFFFFPPLSSSRKFLTYHTPASDRRDQPTSLFGRKLLQLGFQKSCVSLYLFCVSIPHFPSLLPPKFFVAFLTPIFSIQPSSVLLLSTVHSSTSPRVLQLFCTSKILIILKPTKLSIYYQKSHLS